MVKTTFGNMGRGSYSCGNTKDYTENIHISCPYSEIEELVAIGYGDDSSRCTTEV